ncbi:MAG: NAD(P)/FAD-dependent oxidoreductase [Chloroflexi bacterium]|nr:NAD(P)/FAD-dependent oxidoreductase [Chloroflexota bacterium]
MAKTARTKYLIIGNSAGGVGAAEAIRAVDKAGTVTIVSDEPYPAYSRPLISEHLAEGCSLERMLFRPADFCERHGIKTLLGQKVASLSLDEHIARVETGQEIGWEKLLLATGGKPIVPRMEGLESKGVFTFTTLADAKAIAQAITPSSRAVVIGGGLIGVSVTEALVKRGVGVTIVEMKDRILNTILDEEASALAAEALSEHGVEIITGHTVSKVNSRPAKGGSVSSVTLENGRKLPCNLVVVAIGVVPRLDLVAGSDVRTNRGVIVDRHMATSCRDVYACGDVAEAYDFIAGENRVTPVWPNAYLGGRVAGFNMAGAPAEYQGGTAMNSLKYFGLAIVSAGVTNPPDGSYEVVSNIYGSSCRKIWVKDGFIRGMLYSGEIEPAGIVFSLMRDMVNVDSFKERLVAADLGLSSLPEALWRSRLSLPPSVPVTTIPVEEPEEVLVGE